MSTADYRWGGARALVALHDTHLRAFLETWRRADRAGVELPETDDPSYASRERLLLHVLSAAARYLTWISEKLELPRPDVDERPKPEGFAARADAYLEHVLAAWQGPLRGLTEEVSERAFTSRWGSPYTIDAMLEHAVMHPIRHALQLETLMRAR